VHCIIKDEFECLLGDTVIVAVHSSGAEKKHALPIRFLISQLLRNMSCNGMCLKEWKPYGVYVKRIIESAGQAKNVLDMHFTGERKVLPWVLSYLEADPDLLPRQILQATFSGTLEGLHTASRLRPMKTCYPCLKTQGNSVHQKLFCLTFSSRASSVTEETIDRYHVA
jgi:hypothetical protein